MIKNEEYENWLDENFFNYELTDEELNEMYEIFKDKNELQNTIDSLKI